VKRALAVGLFLLGFAAAGTFSAAVIADTGTTVTTTTSATTDAGTSTTTPATTTSASAPVTVPVGVRVAGIRVAGLTAADAVTTVQSAFERPLAVVVDRSRLQLETRSVATAYAATAVARARIASPGTNVQLVVAVKGAPVRAWVARVAARFERKPVDATLTLERGRPKVTEDRPGRTLDRGQLTRRIVAALRANTRLPVRVRTHSIPAKITAAGFGSVIMINRSINRLSLYKSTKTNVRPWRTFAVATGQAIYPTPAGTFHVIVKWKNPWWYPPIQDAWAKGLSPVPPGPSNPLGTRWMGLSAPGVGIHGTDEPASIGYSASHGCIRMQVPDAEWLFDHVQVGTTVFII